jgi:hypothetical protein
MLLHRPVRISPWRLHAGALLRLHVPDGVERPYKPPPTGITPFGAPFDRLDDRIERQQGVALVGPPGSGRRTALEWVADRDCRRRLVDPLVMIADGRDLDGLDDLARALAWVAVDMTGRFVDRRLKNRHPVTVWEAEAKRPWTERPRLSRVHTWRVRPGQRLHRFGRDHEPITLETFKPLWSAISRARSAALLLVIEHADIWAARLTDAERTQLAAVMTGSWPAQVVLLGREAPRFSGWLPDDAIVSTPAAPDAALGPWLVEAFAEGGWTLASEIATQWVAALDHQPAAIARHASVVWERLDPAPGPVGPFDIGQALVEIIARQAATYTAVWDACTSTQQDVLRRVAAEGGWRPTRGRGPEGLKTSSVQRAIEALIARGILWREPVWGSRVRFADALFPHWMIRY